MLHTFSHRCILVFRNGQSIKQRDITFFLLLENTYVMVRGGHWALGSLTRPLLFFWGGPCGATNQSHLSIGWGQDLAVDVLPSHGCPLHAHRNGLENWPRKVTSEWHRMTSKLKWFMIYPMNMLLHHIKKFGLVNMAKNPTTHPSIKIFFEKLWTSFLCF